MSSLSSSCIITSPEDLMKAREGTELHDGRSYDSICEHYIRAQWITERMKGHRPEFTEMRGLDLFIGTYNVNGKKSESDDLSLWISKKASSGGSFDIYAIGFQEIVDLTAVNVAVDVKTVKRSTEWQASIQKVLGESYEAIIGKHLVGLFIVVFARKAVKKYIKDVRAAQLGVGVMGMLGNKGGVSIRMNIFDSSYCFVCAHLAAHRENVSGRNSDARNIIKKTVFPHQGAIMPDPHLSSRPSYGARLDARQALRIENHDHVFFLGDLNYRIQEGIPMDTIFSSIASRELARLRDNDQLNLERMRHTGTVWDDFEEGVLGFSPTYKYQPGTDHYDQRPDKKVRAPAWCDRILWQITDQDELAQMAVQQTSYSCVRGMLVSDHKPVKATFTCQAREVTLVQERAVYERVMASLSKWSKDAYPEVELVGNDISFKPLRYRVPQTSHITMKNMGTSVVHWRVLSTTVGEEHCKPWVTITPTYGLLLPGESAPVAVTVEMDKTTVHALHRGEEVLEDLVVLRVERSFDRYIKIKAPFERTCFGMAIDQLVCLDGPVRGYPIWDQREPSAAVLSQQQWIPKELWRLVYALTCSTGALDTPGLFTARADAAEVEAIGEALDTGAPLPPCTALSLAEVLVSLCVAFDTPIISCSVIPTFVVAAGAELDAASAKSVLNRLLDSLSALNYNVFVYLISFFKQVYQSNKCNLLTTDRLALIGTRCLMGLKEDDSFTSAADIDKLQLARGLIKIYCCPEVGIDE